MKFFPASPRWRAALALLTATAAAATLSAASKTPPNIIFILADDLGYGDLGCYGQKRIPTPNLDRLAAEGMRFTQFYAGCSVCSPSRNCLMTGQDMGHVLVRSLAKVSLRPEDVTVAEVLKTAGYATGAIGKWGLGAEGGPGAPTHKGFDYFFGYVDQTMAHNYYPTFLVRDGTHVPLRNVVPKPGRYGQGIASTRVDYSADLIGSDAVAYIRDHHRDHFFLYFCPTLPHANDEMRTNGMEIPTSGPYANYGPFAKEDWPDTAKGYATMVAILDKEVGDIMAELKAQKIDQETIVMFSSDNGPHEEGGNDPYFFHSMGPLRGIKASLYEGGMREPMIVRWPGHTPAGSVCYHVGYFGDFMATAAEIAGARIPPHTQSVSFLPAMLGQLYRQDEHYYLYWELSGSKTPQAVRAADWKLVRVAPMFTGKLELYNLATDPLESQDMAAKRPDILAALRSVMDEARTPEPSWNPGVPRIGNNPSARQ